MVEPDIVRKLKEHGLVEEASTVSQLIAELKVYRMAMKTAEAKLNVYRRAEGKQQQQP